jgi:hypothetical protein
LKSISLKEELEFFESMRAEWVGSYRDRFVLIKGKDLVGVFDTFGDAYRIGVEKFGNHPFLIKRVTEEEQIEKFPALTLGIVHANL